jgi:hypothetical protein
MLDSRMVLATFSSQAATTARLAANRNPKAGLHCKAALSGRFTQKKNSGNIYPYCAERDAYMLQTKQANLTKFSNSLKVTATKKVVLKDWSNKNRPQLKPQLQFPSSRRKTKLYAHLN